jgi:hypothetical protein
MKTLSFASLLLAGLCLVLALASHFLTSGRLVFHWYTYVQGTSIFLLASIALAAQHIIQQKK